MGYQFKPGQRVRHWSGRTGEVVTCVPGDGILAWYFVLWDGPNWPDKAGTVEDRHTASELEAE